MSRKSPRSISVNPNVRITRIYPTEDTQKDIKELKTIGIRLTRDQALHLARVLLAVTQDWDNIDITAYRYEKRKSDSTYRITVTNLQSE